MSVGISAANADRVAIRFKAESTFGEALAANPKFQALRVTGESFGQETQYVESQDLVDDRQTADLIRTQISSPADINFEMSYGTYDELLQAALMSAAWSAAVTIAADTDVSFAASVGDLQTITKTGGGFNALTAGMWMRVSGATNTTNNGYAKIVAIGSDTAVAVQRANGVLEAASASIGIVQGGQIVNGTTMESFNFEREYTDVTGFALFTGCTIDGLVISMTADQLITGSLNFFGKKETSEDATTGDGSPTAAPTNTPMNAVDNVNGMWEGTALMDMSAFTMNVRNNLRGRSIIGTRGAAGFGAGKVGVNGTLQKFYASKTLMDKHLNATPSALASVVEDGAGNGYVFDMPKVKFVGGKRVAGGINTDIVADMAWQAYKDATTGITCRIQRFPV